MILNRNIRANAEFPTQSELEYKKNNAPGTDNYYNRLVKLIPAEAIAFYLALDGIASNMTNSDVLLWIIFLISIGATWFYIIKMTNVRKFFQQFWTVLAFCIWVFVIGGPFQQYEWYDENYGKLLVTIYTFFMPLVYKP